MQHLQSSNLQSLNLLEERIQRAVELVTFLKSERARLQAEVARLEEGHRAFERRLEAQVEEKQDLLEEGRVLRAKQEEWMRFERDRDEIRTRIDSMLAKFEELEI